jgi:hypothetical protein
MENTEFDDTLLPLFSELDMAIFMPSIDLTVPEEAAPEAPPDADDLLRNIMVPVDIVKVSMNSLNRVD